MVAPGVSLISFIPRDSTYTMEVLFWVFVEIAFVISLWGRVRQQSLEHNNRWSEIPGAGTDD